MDGSRHSSGSGGGQGVTSWASSGSNRAVRHPLWTEHPKLQSCVSGEVAGESSNGSEDRQGSPCRKSPRLLTTEVTEVENTLWLLAEEEKWSDGWLVEKLRELRAPADHLIETAKKTWEDIAVDDWEAKMCSVAKEAVEAAMEALEE